MPARDAAHEYKYAFLVIPYRSRRSTFQYISFRRPKRSPWPSSIQIISKAAEQFASNVYKYVRFGAGVAARIVTRKNDCCKAVLADILCGCSTGGTQKLPLSAMRNISVPHIKCDPKPLVT